MTVLIAGGCGFIGLNIAEACLNAGEEVLLLDRNPIPSEAVRAFADLPGRWHHAEVDITDESAVLAVFNKHSIHEVYYGAAITSGPERERTHPEQVIAVNVLGLAHVIKAAVATGVRRMINISSGSAYGDGGFSHSGAVAPLDEVQSRAIPTSLYSVSKFAGEGLCRRMAQLTTLDVFSVRLAIIFGPWELDSGFRDTLSAPMQAAKIAIAGGMATFDREDVRDWTYSRDVAQALHALMAADEHQYDLYNISAERCCSSLDWALALKPHFTSFDARLRDKNESANVNLHGEIDRLPMSARRLHKDIGHNVPGDITSSAADFAMWIKKHPDYWQSVIPSAHIPANNDHNSGNIDS